MINEHYEAVKGMIPAGLTIYMWKVPKEPAYPYVVLWGDLGTETTEAMDDEPDALELRIKATYGALTGGSLAWIAGKVRSALNRRSPVVAGWAPGRLHQQSLMDAQTDYDVTFPGGGGHPVFAVDEFDLLSQKAG